MTEQLYLLPELHIFGRLLDELGKAICLRVPFELDQVLIDFRTMKKDLIVKAEKGGRGIKQASHVLNLVCLPRAGSVYIETVPQLVPGLEVVVIHIIFVPQPAKLLSNRAKPPRFQTLTYPPCTSGSSGRGIPK